MKATTGKAVAGFCLIRDKLIIQHANKYKPQATTKHKLLSKHQQSVNEFTLCKIVATCFPPRP